MQISTLTALAFLTFPVTGFTSEFYGSDSEDACPGISFSSLTIQPQNTQSQGNQSEFSKQPITDLRERCYDGYCEFSGTDEEPSNSNSFNFSDTDEELEDFEVSSQDYFEGGPIEPSEDDEKAESIVQKPAKHIFPDPSQCYCYIYEYEEAEQNGPSMVELFGANNVEKVAFEQALQPKASYFKDLTKLNLSHKNLYNMQVFDVLSAARHSRDLKSIDLSHNNMTSNGLIGLDFFLFNVPAYYAFALTFKDLSSIDLSHNQLDDGIKKRLLMLLKHGQKFCTEESSHLSPSMTIYLGNNNLSTDVMSDIQNASIYKQSIFHFVFA